MAYLNETGLARFWNHILSKLNEKATQSDIDTAVANLVNSAPETLDTLGELATALENNADVVETLNQTITNKADKSYVDEQVANLETDSPISLDRIDEICGSAIVAGEEVSL